MTFVHAARAAAAGACLTALAVLAAPAASAADAPVTPEAPAAAEVTAAHDAAAAPATLDTLSRFFSRDGAVSRSAAAPRIEGATVPVYTLSPAFVAVPRGAALARTPIAELEFCASKAVASDGQEASVWSVRQGGAWQVVNIATGADESRYAAQGTRKLKGGTVFREPQIDAWYVQRGDRVMPLDPDATRAIGAGGTTVRAYHERVRRAYGDKLPGSPYAAKGKAGGYGEETGPEPDGGAPARAGAAGTGDGPPAGVPAVAGAGALAALALGGVAVLRARRRSAGDRA
ncbi:hypothetical protein [Streptomyces sp. NPDC018031]|uniref:hypothetical protein n=1 Tax=Streptomyces sp. NPDC018031 TaxID=3365033 RepID=UPI0037B1F9A3